MVVTSVDEEAEKVTDVAVARFLFIPPLQVKISSWPAAEPAPITIASVSASVVVCEVVELVTATDVAPAHVHVTLVASAKLQRAFDAVSVIVLVARTDRVGVTLIIMPLGVPATGTGVPVIARFAEERLVTPVAPIAAGVPAAVPANPPLASVVMVQSFVPSTPPSEEPRMTRVSLIA